MIIKANNAHRILFDRSNSAFGDTTNGPPQGFPLINTASLLQERTLQQPV